MESQKTPAEINVLRTFKIYCYYFGNGYVGSEGVHCRYG